MVYFFDSSAVVKRYVAEPGSKLWVDCRGKMVEAEVVKGPFYKRGKA